MEKKGALAECVLLTCNRWLAGLVKCKTKDKRTEASLTEVSGAEEITKEVNNWCLSYQTKVRGDSRLL